MPLTNFVDIQGLVEYLEEKTEEIYNGTNRYVIAGKVLTQIIIVRQQGEAAQGAVVRQDDNQRADQARLHRHRATST